MSEVCPLCGDKYSQLATHWSRSKDCSTPELSERQEEIITGLVMGDGSVVVANKNPSLHVKMITEEFLSWVDENLGWLSNGYTLTQTAKEAAKENRESGFSPNAVEENYSDKFTLRSKCVNHLWDWRDWYGKNGKKFPKELELTPTILKVWYCCDGSMETYNSKPHIAISCNNESDNIDYLLRLFGHIDVEPVPHESKRSFNLRFNQSDSIKLWEYMGEPLPGFEYKWPNTYQHEH
jgi:hypothetical protein